SVFISPTGNISKSGDYLEYEIFPHLNNTRFKNIVSLFENIFAGKIITFISGPYRARINLENSFEMMKFHLVKDFVLTYDESQKYLNCVSESRFYESPVSYYALFVLDNLMKKSEYATWIDFSIDEKINLSNYQEIKIIREIPVAIKGGNCTIFETIKFLDKFYKKDLPVAKDGKISLKNVRVKIILEKE
ncbi:MAG: hypothetical protein ACRCSK_08760, partial [Fusobacteriaceae bacterium]